MGGGGFRFEIECTVGKLPFGFEILDMGGRGEGGSIRHCANKEIVFWEPPSDFGQISP